MIGNKILNFNAYRREAGKRMRLPDVTSYKRPPVEFLSDTIKGAGINGEINLPSLGQLGSMEIEIAFRLMNAEVAELMKSGDHEIEVVWAHDSINPATHAITVVASKEIMKIASKKADIGKVEGGTTGDGTITAEVLYYHWIENGISVLEIDRFNGVYKVYGVDQTAKIREAIS